ncbi:MAG: ABC transporter permease, partial [Candidatus Marinimicrobia bacterium]|nr:ABC transporter permease [Candidatus Neomarinimicrobiota bacterium]
MKHLLRMAQADIGESIRARWFFVYTVVFGTIMVGLLVSGLTESRIMGFTGLSRLLVTYIQITMAILPIFMLITTVRSVVGDREAGVYEYMLSLPVGLAAWYWGKLLGRFIVIFLPVILAMMLAVGWGLIKGVAIPWSQVILYTILLDALIICFLGIGMLISTLSKSTDVAQGAAFLIWLF